MEFIEIMEIVARVFLVSFFVFIAFAGFSRGVEIADKNASDDKKFVIKFSGYITFTALLIASFVIVAELDLGFPWAPIYLICVLVAGLAKQVFSWKTVEYKKPTLMHVVTTNLSIIGGLMLLVIKGL